jgi:hypothetical protein
MTIALPTRIISGAVFASVFTGIGLGVGYACANLLHTNKAQLAHLVSLPLFIGAVWYVRQVWRFGSHSDPDSRITALPPRLQAVIFGGCLGLGLVLGAAISHLTTGR